MWGLALRFFQYPLSDRTHCNRRGQLTLIGDVTTFSILYRIEPTVTFDTVFGVVIGLCAFSILYRIEPTVTERAF